MSFSTNLHRGWFWILDNPYLRNRQKAYEHMKQLNRGIEIDEVPKVDLAIKPLF
jgi:hypothetical protein